MTIFFIIVFSFLFIALIGVIIMLVRQTKKEGTEKQNELVKELLDKKEFLAKNIYYISDGLVIAISQSGDKIAVIEFRDELDIEKANYRTINSNLIIDIEKNNYGICLNYIYQGKKDALLITTKKVEIENLIHDIYKNACVNKLQAKYSINSFQYTAASDWECSYVWAFRQFRSTFAYSKNKDKKAMYKLNLLKEFFTIDSKFNYFEAPILGIPQEISIYESSFLNDILLSLIRLLKMNCSVVSENRIYYDSYNEIVYLTNGVSSLQSIILDRVVEVFYNEDRLTFELDDNDKVIDFIADKVMLEDFENFITSYNLRKIATSFDYKIDKLINTTDGTKFIVDTSRDRVVYCAGLNSLSKFSYMTIMFSNLEDASVEKTKDGYFVRIITKDKDIIDVTCKKSSVAQYIHAQIMTIVNS